VLVADTLFANDENGSTHPFVRVRSFDLRAARDGNGPPAGLTPTLAVREA